MENTNQIDLSSALKSKAGWFLLASILLLALAFFLNGIFVRDRNARNTMQEKVQQVLHEKETKMDNLIVRIIAGIPGSDLHLADSIIHDDLYRKSGMIVFISLNGSLVYWSDNSVPFHDAWVESTAEETFVRLKDGYYVMKSKRAGPAKIIGLILIKKDYPYQNNYLENEFQHDFSLSNDVKITAEKGDLDFYSLNGTYLFSLHPEKFTKASDIQSLLLFFLCLASLVFLLSSMFLLYGSIPFLDNRPLLLLLAFLLDVIILRLAFRYFEWPGFLYGSQLFSPYFFATSWMEPSLGDLLVNRLMLLIMAYAFFRKYRLNYGHQGALLRNVTHGLQVLTVILLYFILFRSVRELVMDSSMILNLNDISDIDRYSLMAFGALTASILSFFLISTRLLINIRNNCRIPSEYVLACMAAFLLTLTFIGLTPVIPCRWPVCVIILAYILSYHYFLRKPDTIHQLPAIVFFMILFAISATFMLNHYNAEKELEKRKVISASLTSKRDPLLEYEFMKLAEKLENDSLVSRYFFSEAPDQDAADKLSLYLDQQYFSSFWNKYEMLITECDANEMLNIQPGNYLVNCFEYFDNMIRDLGVPTISENLYYIDNQTENNNYIAVIQPDTILNGLKDRRLYIELFYKFMPSTGLGYPELLIDKEISMDSRITDYSYARYVENKLVYKYGDYFYHLDFNKYSRDGKESYFLDRDGYNHYIVCTDSDNWLVISRKNPAFFDIVAPFSYMFLFFSVFLVAFIAILYIGGGYHKIEMNFRNRLQFAIITIIIASLIILGLITRAYIIDLNNKKNTGYLTEKTYSVLVELEHKIGDYDSIPPAMEGYIAELLYKFAQVFFSDINLYSTAGDLIASSRPQIFEENLLSRKMNRQAFTQLAYEKSLLYIHNEQIGKQEYLSAYIPLRSNQDRITAYLNLPYFARQDEMRKEIADFISAYINIYVLLIVMAILVTILVSRYVTQPLKLIREKLRNLSYSHSGEKIVWKREDEIGELVAEYNRTLDELARSAEMLARSERESAWREMAKQVAHEIKNPLTPMKLSVQYLKKAWDEKAPDWEQRLERFSRTIVEQIDSLSRIASEFSDFAKMPVASYEKIDLLETARSSAELYRNVGNVKIAVNSINREAFISADRQQMLRVFNNLINNSVQAIGKKEDGRIDITIIPSGNIYRIEVADNGSGIPKEQAERIFSPSFTTKSGGMGLGLAMVKNILSGIGATISFISEEGVGTTFVLEIPAVSN